MTFYKFMMKRYLNNNDRRSDLAHDMHSDKDSFPKNNEGKFDAWHKVIYEYLLEKGACFDALSVFEKCWKEYVECVKKR